MKVTYKYFKLNSSFTDDGIQNYYENDLNDEKLLRHLNKLGKSGWKLIKLEFSSENNGFEGLFMR